jgi:hypothetical protein
MTKWPAAVIADKAVYNAGAMAVRPTGHWRGRTVTAGHSAPVNW